jgi:hypothetical protein
VLAEHKNDPERFQLPDKYIQTKKSYLSPRTAVMGTNTLRLEREVNKGCP